MSGPIRYLGQTARCRVLSITGELVVEVIRGLAGHDDAVRLEGFPADARCVAVMPSSRIFNAVDLLVHSDEFDEVPEGFPWPWLDVTVHRSPRTKEIL